VTTIAEDDPTRDLPHVLIVEDAPDVAARLEKRAARCAPVALASAKREAIELLAGRSLWCGAILDIGLPDGSGLDLLDAFRAKAPRAPALVLTGQCSPELINRAQRARAEYAVKPAAPANIQAFLSLVTEFLDARSREIDVIIAELASRHRLSACEQKLLAASARGTSRKELATELGIAENTVKTQMRALLRKCEDAEQLSDLTREVWRRSTEG
jgi:DNA-binding NarL/FixJ family response regulator